VPQARPARTRGAQAATGATAPTRGATGATGATARSRGDATSP